MFKIASYPRGQHSQHQALESDYGRQGEELKIHAFGYEKLQ